MTKCNHNPMNLNGDPIMEFRNEGNADNDLPDSFKIDICTKCKLLYAYDPTEIE